MTLWSRRFHRIPPEWREAYTKRRSHEQLLGDVSVAFDRIEATRLKLWILGGVVTGEGALIAWLATELISRLGK